MFVETDKKKLWFNELSGLVQELFTENVQFSSWAQLVEEALSLQDLLC